MSEIIYRKITDVEQVSTLNDTATVFINDDGSLKQLPVADVLATSEQINELSKEIEALKGGSEDDYREETFTPDIQGYLLMTGSFNDITTKARRTDYISLEGCTHIKAQYRLATNGCAVAFFDANKAFMSDVSVAGVGLDSDTITEMEPPAGSAYVMLSHYLGSDLNYVGFITLSYGTPAVVYDGNLAGVTVDVLGDSISSVAYVTPNYWQMIAEKTGCVFNDYAVSGTRIATVEGDAKESFLTRAARMDTNADAVLVMGGTNDVGLHTLLGEWDSEDESTFYGALNALITLLRTNFPGKPIIFCTPIKRKYDTDNGFPDTMADLKAASATEQITMQHCVLAIKAKCARHGIPVIDLAEHSGFSALTPEYYRAEDDNLHPSALGFMRIANMVQAELEKQFLHTIKEDAEGTEQATYTPDIQGYVKVPGTIMTTGSSRRTDYLALDGVTRIVAQYRITNTAYALAFYDSNKTLMQDVSIVGEGTDKDYTVDVAPPADAAYCIFSHYPGSSGYTGWVTLYS